ncbi:aftiphilin-like isoform X4 [Mizuhopecten yessoensis]|uniref:aftiphilin-like isoform X4 n=1 Tax=Mizuhopecten yessoensis TaxID=6573 RepID=UPI000B45A5B7|nr:aftiphilin-like isoform X4 [Mizuhopecten yessoensis]
MTNFIPMVSSSPPPLEDGGGGGFNEWDDEDDDFGTFATATNGNDFQAFSDQSSADQWNNIPDMPSVPPNCEFGKFADFSNFESDSKIDCMQNGDMTPEAVDNDTLSNDSKEGDNEDKGDSSNKSGGMKLSLKTVNDFVNNDNVQESPVMPCDDSDQQKKMHKSQSDNLDSISSVISAGDSGLCSTDISPVPQSDDNVGPEDNSQESDPDDFGDFHSDSSVGKEALRGSTENMEVIEECGGNVSMVNSENNDSSANSNNQVANGMGPESVEDREIRTSQLNGDSNCDSVSEQEVHERVSPLSHCENTNQYNSRTSPIDKDDHSKKEESLCPEETDEERWAEGPDTEDRLGIGQSPDAGKENQKAVVDIEERCLVVDPDTVEDTKNVQDQSNTDNRHHCGNVVSDETKEECHNEIDSEKSELVRTCSAIKAVAERDVNHESTMITLKHSDAPVCDEAEDDKTFHEVDDNETDCGGTEQLQDMKDSGFVFADLSSSEEENCEKKEQEPEAKLDENCDISKQTVDNNEDFNVIDNEEWCEDSVSPGSKEVQATENDIIKPQPCPGSDDEFDDFADFSSAPSFSVQEGCEVKSGDVSVNERSPSTINEQKSAVQDINYEDEEEFDDFADFHSSKPVELDIQLSKPLPQEVTGGNEKSESLDGDSGNCNKDDVDDDSDSFANFGTSFTSKSSENNSGTSAVVTDETKSGSDSFAAFPSASAADGDHDDEDDWATFQAPPTLDQVGAGSNDDEDFGEFEDFDNAGKPKGSSTSSAGDFATFKQPEPVAVKPVEKRTSREVINCCFPECDGTDLDDSATNKMPLLLDDCFNGDVAVEDKTTTGPLIWLKLKSPNSTIEISKLWSDSHSNGKLFTTLRIDTRNILLGHRKPSVPVYAANLTLLEPTKGPTPPSETADTNKLVDMTKVDDKPASQDLPPVQFDWTNSGLTNPLEGSEHDIAAEIVVKEAEAVAKMGDEWDWVFDSELMHGQRDPKAAMQPLENILANLKSSSTIRPARPAENLTPEATKVITSLPSLSFMQARSLMFPFKQSSDVA